jgi:hypothetical protein
MADSSGFTLPARPTGTTDTPFTNTMPGGANLPYGSLGAQLLDAFGISRTLGGRPGYQNNRYANILNQLQYQRGWGAGLPGGGQRQGGYGGPGPQPGLLSGPIPQQAQQMPQAMPQSPQPVQQPQAQQFDPYAALRASMLRMPGSR